MAPRRASVRTQTLRSPGAVGHPARRLLSFSRIFGPALLRVLCAPAWLAVATGCTCTSTGASRPNEDTVAAADAPREVTIEVGTQPGALPVTFVLDPTGALCRAASRASAGRRHVLCDQTDQDLAAAKLKEALKRLKKQAGPAVAPGGVWVLATAERAPVARALSVQEPTFFSRVAVWLGDSPAAARLFGPGYWHEVGPGTLQAVLLIGPGAAQADTWTTLAERQGVRLRALPEVVSVDDPAVWARIDQEFATAKPVP
jgi:hypothetical protein